MYEALGLHRNNQKSNKTFISSMYLFFRASRNRDHSNAINKLHGIQASNQRTARTTSGVGSKENQLL